MSILSQFKQSQNTDFPNVRPSLDLRFALAKKLDPRITFTRGSTGTYFGSDGIMRTAGVNEPRFDHDPITGQSLGLLIEESRTNNVFASDRVDASWLITVSGGSGTFIDGEKVTSSILSVDATYDASLSTSSTFILRNSLSGQPYGTLTGLSSGATRTINSQINIGGQGNVSAFLTTETTAPDGSFNACLVTPTTVSLSSRAINKRFTTSTAGTYTFSIFFKNKNIKPNNNVAIYIGNQSSTSNVYANFNISTKTFSTGQTGGWTGSVGYQDYANGWGRIWVTATTTASSHTFLDCSLWIGGYQGNYTSIGSFYAWGMQLEAGAVPTSYIPTTASTVTRSNDFAWMIGTNFSSWCNQNEGTIIISTDKLYSGNFDAYRHYYQIGDFNVANVFGTIYSIPSATTITNYGTTNATRQVFDYQQIFVGSSPTQFKIGQALNSKYSFFTSSKGTTSPQLPSKSSPNSQNNTTPTSVDRMWIGRKNSGGEINSHISRLTYYPIQLTNQQLINLTS